MQDESGSDDFCFPKEKTFYYSNVKKSNVETNRSEDVQNESVVDFVSKYLHHSLKILYELQCLYERNKDYKKDHENRKNTYKNEKKTGILNVSNVDYWLKYHKILSNVKHFMVFLCFYNLNNTEHGVSTRCNDVLIGFCKDFLFSKPKKSHETVYKNLSDTVSRIMTDRYSCVRDLFRSFEKYDEKYDDDHKNDDGVFGKEQYSNKDPYSNDVFDFFESYISKSNEIPKVFNVKTYEQYMSSYAHNVMSQTTENGLNIGANIDILTNIIRTNPKPSAPVMDQDVVFERTEHVEMTKRTPLNGRVNNYGPFETYGTIEDRFKYPSLSNVGRNGEAKECDDNIKWKCQSKTSDIYLKLFSQMFCKKAPPTTKTDQKRDDDVDGEDDDKNVVVVLDFEKKIESHVDWLWCNILLNMFEKRQTYAYESKKIDIVFDLGPQNANSNGFFLDYMCILEDHAELSLAIHHFFSALQANTADITPHWGSEYFSNFTSNHDKNTQFDEGCLKLGPFDMYHADGNPFYMEKKITKKYEKESIDDGGDDDDKRDDRDFFSPSWWISKLELKHRTEDSKKTPKKDTEIRQHDIHLINKGVKSDMRSRLMSEHVLKANGLGFENPQRSNMIDEMIRFYDRCKNLRGAYSHTTSATQNTKSEYEPKTGCVNLFLIFAKTSYQTLYDMVAFTDRLSEYVSDSVGVFKKGDSMSNACEYLLLYGFHYLRFSDGTIRNVVENRSNVEKRMPTYLEQFDIKVDMFKISLSLYCKSQTRFANALLYVLQLLTMVNVRSKMSELSNQNNLATMSDSTARISAYTYERFIQSIMFDYKRSQLELQKKTITSKNDKIRSNFLKCVFFCLFDAMSPKFYELYVKKIRNKVRADRDFFADTLSSFDEQTDFLTVLKDFEFFSNSPTKDKIHAYCKYVNAQEDVCFESVCDKDWDYLKQCSQEMEKQWSHVTPNVFFSNFFAFLTSSENYSKDVILYSLLSLKENFKTFSDYEKLKKNLVGLEKRSFEDKSDFVVDLGVCRFLDRTLKHSAYDNAALFEKMKKQSEFLDCLHVYSNVYTKFKTYDKNQWRMVSQICNMFVTDRIKTGETNNMSFVHSVPGSDGYRFQNISFESKFVNENHVQMIYVTTKEDSTPSALNFFCQTETGFKSLLSRAIVYIGSCVEYNSNLKDILANDFSLDGVSTKCEKMYASFAERVNVLRQLRATISKKTASIPITCDNVKKYRQALEYSNLSYDMFHSEGSVFGQCENQECKSEKKRCDHLKLYNSQNLPSILDCRFEDPRLQRQLRTLSNENSKPTLYRQYYDKSRSFMHKYAHLLPCIDRLYTVIHTDYQIARSQDGCETSSISTATPNGAAKKAVCSSYARGHDSRDDERVFKWMFVVVMLVNSLSKSCKVFECDVDHDRFTILYPFSKPKSYDICSMSDHNDFVENVDDALFFSKSFVKISESEEPRPSNAFFKKLIVPKALALLYDVASKKLNRIDFSNVSRDPVSLCFEKIVSSSNLFGFFIFSDANVPRLNSKKLLHFKKNVLKDENVTPNIYDWFILYHKLDRGDRSNKTIP